MLLMNDAATLHLHASHSRISALSRMLELVLELNNLSDLAAVLEAVTCGACDAVECERASLFLHDPQTRELYTHSTTELEIEEIRLPMDRGIIGHVAMQRMPLVVPDPPADPRWSPAFDEQTGYRTRNVLAVPVISKSDGRLLGVLQLLNKHHGHFESFDVQLMQAFALHAGSAMERQLLQVAAQQAEDFKRSIEMARQIQMGFLPKGRPEFPLYEVAAWWEPAEYVSGDYYDWIVLPDGRLGVVLGDVSGHGMAASLIMASVRAMIHVLSRLATTPADMMELLQDAVQTDLVDGRFLTLLLLAIDPETHCVEFANAGHAPAMHFKAAKGTCRRLEATRTPLGFPAMATGRLPIYPVMQPGDVLVLGTDGLIEIHDANGHIFGTKRLEQLIARHAHLSADELAQALRKEVFNFSPTRPFADDMTLLIIKRKPVTL
ncbi:MAG: hypothetical protein C0478_03305 [Planctomyces sp.]|nr:hypothetical protein [Planctomyces sp.]